MTDLDTTVIRDIDIIGGPSGGDILIIGGAC